MSTIGIGRVSTLKVGGLALIIAGVLLAAGNILVISVLQSMGQERGTAAYATVVVRHRVLWHLGHIMLVLAPILWSVGFLTLYEALARKGEQVYALSALVVLGVATVFHLQAAVPGGFVTPVLGHDYLVASLDRQDAAAAMLAYSRLLSVTLAAVAILLEILGTGLFSIALLRANLYAQWIAWLGITIGSVGGLGYLAGIFGPYWISSPLFLPLGGAASAWIIALGIAQWRGEQMATRRTLLATRPESST